MKQPSTTPVVTALLMALLLVTLTGASSPGPAGAYVLEGPHLLALTADAMGRIPALQLQQKVMITPPSPDRLPIVLDETATYIMPQRFRSDQVTDRMQRTHLVVGDSSLTVLDGRFVVADSPFDHYQRLLRSRTREQLMRTLSRMGVQTAISSLGRVDETVVFVIGARYPDESVSQLAVDKTTFLPLRLLLVDRHPTAGGGRLVIFYHDWRKVQNGWFPFQVTFTIDDRLEREIRVADLQVNPSIPAEAMDLEAFAAGAAVRNAESPDVRKQEAVEAVQEVVEAFRKKFE